MLGEKALLSVTLATTFVAGGVTGFAVRDLRPDEPFRPRSAEHVYAPRLRALRDAGYSEPELREAVRIHQDYLDGYDKWWQAFAETHDANLAQLDGKFERELAELASRVEERKQGR
jgi:hypothetical protein